MNHIGSGLVQGSYSACRDMLPDAKHHFYISRLVWLVVNFLQFIVLQTHQNVCTLWSIVKGLNITVLTIVLLITIIFTISEASGCTDPYTAYGSHCYCYFSTSYTYTQAMYHCYNHGGYISELSSQAEQDFVQGIYRPQIKKVSTPKSWQNRTISLETVKMQI